MKNHSGPVNYSSAQVAGGLSIVGLINEGVYFRIYKAKCGTKYVILKTPISADTMSLEILRREYELCRTLSHPCIVNTIGFEESSPIGPAIVMEFIDGLTLDEFVAHGATSAQCKSALRDILDGVDYLHHRGILHNDLKPDNVIVNVNGAARIIDFGLSSSADSIFKGCLGGSHVYTAPEVLDGRGSLGATSDIYSIGTLIRILFGNRQYASISRKCCRKEPAERYQNIESLRVAIARSNHRPYFILGILALCSIVALAIYPAITGIAEKEKFENTKTRIASEIELFYKPIPDSILLQKDIKSAESIQQRYVEHYIHYLDSLEKAHPMKEDGIIPQEVVAASEIIRAQWEVLDSIIAHIPSK